MKLEGAIQVRVSRKRMETEDIASFELVPVEGTLPHFSAGSHIDVYLPNGMIRQYSLCNEADQVNRYQIGVLRDPKSRGGSIWMLDKVSEGDVIRISDPKNHFPLAHGAQRSILIAGGIGVTPIISMAERLSSVGSDFDFHYCSRSLSRAAFVDRIKRSAFAERVKFHLDDGPQQQRFDPSAVLVEPNRTTHLYVCGPAGFLDFVLTAARTAGWEESCLHREYFAASPVSETGASDAFEVQIASTGKIVFVPADRTVVQALADEGIDIPLSCEQGVCGTCLTRIIEGEPDHRDMFLTDAERLRNDQFTPCCSRSKCARLVLDL
jgi:vanillate monooxygenase ferredoxin subunit